MSKQCENCGNKIGFWDQDLRFADKKFLCSNCLVKFKFSKDAKHDTPTSKAIDWAFNHNYKDFEVMKDNNQTFADILKAQNDEIKPTNFSSPSDNTMVQKAAEKINKLPIPREIKKQLIDTEVFDLSFNNKELKALPKILDYKNGEEIKYAASGTKVEGEETRTVLVICTNRRVIFLNKNMFFGGDSTDIPLNMINSVQLVTHLLLADISITTGANTTMLKQLTKESAGILAKTIKQESLKFQQQMLHPNVNETKSTDSADEIRKFKQLADDGIITQEEFEAKKKQLLGL